MLQRELFEPGRLFCDRQIRGIFDYYRHSCRAMPLEVEGSCEIEEKIDFAFAGSLGARIVGPKLERMLLWQHRTMAHDLATLARYPKWPKKILLSGSNGLVGRALSAFLRAAGHEVVPLLRNKRQQGEGITWEPKSGTMDLAQLEGFDALIHLAGSNIGQRPWTEAYKKELFLSRCRDTWLLAESLLRLRKPPRVFLCASAVGYYGNRGNELLAEGASCGEGFLSELCKRWEEAAHRITDRGIRVVHARFGVVLSPAGGMLSYLLPIVQSGIGAVAGSGEQFVSWIGIDDLLAALYHLLMQEDLGGAINLCTPYPVTNREFIETLARVCHRRVRLRLPSKLLHAFLGEFADEMILASSRAVPEKLLASGYQFRYPKLDETLHHILGRV